MRQPGGYATIIDPGASRLVEEFDTITCPHCGFVAMTRAGLRATPQVMIFRADGTHYMKDAGFCRDCYQHVCPRCDGKPCDNRFRRLDREEAEARKLII
jgi:hypothetical protein